MRTTPGNAVFLPVGRNDGAKVWSFLGRWMNNVECDASAVWTAFLSASNGIIKIHLPRLVYQHGRPA